MTFAMIHEIIKEMSEALVYEAAFDKGNVDLNKLTAKQFAELLETYVLHVNMLSYNKYWKE